MSFQIEIKGQLYKARQSSSLHLISGFALVGMGACTFLLANADWIKTVFHAPILPGFVLGSISLVVGIIDLYLTFFRNKWLQIPSNNENIRLLNVCVNIGLALVFLLSQWWLAAGITGIVGIANIFAYFYEQKAQQALFVHIGKEQILLPATARKKQLAWTEIEKVLLRHGTLTIDCTNNYLYQWTIKHNNIDHDAVEAFSRALIESNRSKRQNEDW